MYADMAIIIIFDMLWILSLSLFHSFILFHCFVYLRRIYTHLSYATRFCTHACTHAGDAWNTFAFPQNTNAHTCQWKMNVNAWMNRSFFSRQINFHGAYVNTCRCAENERERVSTLSYICEYLSCRNECTKALVRTHARTHAHLSRR